MFDIDNQFILLEGVRLGLYDVVESIIDIFTI
jgi:hypothetical protein